MAYITDRDFIYFFNSYSFFYYFSGRGACGGGGGRGGSGVIKPLASLNPDTFTIITILFKGVCVRACGGRRQKGSRRQQFHILYANRHKQKHKVLL